MSFTIITDSTANLKKSFLKLSGIKSIMMPYFIDGKEFTCGDVEAFDADKYYSDIKDGMTVNTSQINPHIIGEVFEESLKYGKDIMFIGLSSGVSGTFRSAEMAAAEVREKYPERKIYLIDSLGAALGIGLCVYFADEFRKKGLDIDTVFKKVSDIRDRMYQVFIVDDLMHLKRTGRLSNASALVGTMLGIKPLLKGSREGKIVPADKVRGRKQAIKAMAERCTSFIKDTSVIGITYAGCKEDADHLVNLIKEKVKIGRVIMEKHEPVTGAHIGPGSLALYFVGDTNVRDL